MNVRAILLVDGRISCGDKYFSHTYYAPADGGLLSHSAFTHSQMK